jgi:septum site-determining protein MinC
VLRAPAVRAPEPQFQKATLIVTEPVRSGRQVYAAKGDLVILGPVSAGAEVLADGNIHIYNTLRGRALAGITGDTSARIFCNSLEAELVSIAGLYRVSEDLDRNVYKKQVQIYLDDGYLRMDALA